MPAILSDLAVERSTYVIIASFTDEEGEAVVPQSGLNWTLTDRKGNVINERDAVTISPSTSVTIVLTGADLDADDGPVRILTIEGAYDSDLGSGLPLKEQVTFHISNLVAV